MGSVFLKIYCHKTFQYAFHLLACWFLWPWRWRRYVPPKRRLTLNGLHGVISQKMILLISLIIYCREQCLVLYRNNSVFKELIILSVEWQKICSIRTIVGIYVHFLKLENPSLLSPSLVNLLWKLGMKPCGRFSVAPISEFCHLERNMFMRLVYIAKVG
jgi:hypothetical protein